MIIVPAVIVENPSRISQNNERNYSEIAPTPGSSRNKNESKAFSSNVLSFSQIEAAEMDKK